MKSHFQYKVFGGGGGSSSIVCPFKLTKQTDTEEVSYKVGRGLVNNVVVNDTSVFYPIASQFLVLGVNTTNVRVNDAAFYIGYPGDPPIPQIDYPVNYITIPIYYFDTDLKPERLIGCNNVMVFPHVAFTQEKTDLTDPTAYPYSNFWNWAIWC